ncbi:MAG: 8-oxo-dGTP diphosphatase MutT [Woeseiaceae bacterium]
MRSIHVAAGILVRDGHALIAQRPAGSHGEQFWEFPGGKVEPGETASQALLRELREEIGVSIQSAEPALQISHQYEKHHVDLDFFLVLKWSGDPCGREGQKIDWCSIDALDRVEFLPANQPVTDWLKSQRLTET